MKYLTFVLLLFCSCTKERFKGSSTFKLDGVAKEFNYCKAYAQPNGKLEIALYSHNSNSSQNNFSIIIANLDYNTPNQQINKFNINNIPHSKIYYNIEADNTCASADVNTNFATQNWVTNLKVDGKKVSGNFTCYYKIAPNTNNNCNGALPDSFAITEGWFETKILK